MSGKDCGPTCHGWCILDVEGRPCHEVTDDEAGWAIRGEPCGICGEAFR